MILPPPPTPHTHTQVNDHKEPMLPHLKESSDCLKQLAPELGKLVKLLTQAPVVVTIQLSRPLPYAKNTVHSTISGTASCTCFWFFAFWVFFFFHRMLCQTQVSLEYCYLPSVQSRLRVSFSMGKLRRRSPFCFKTSCLWQCRQVSSRQSDGLSAHLTCWETQYVHTEL